MRGTLLVLVHGDTGQITSIILTHGRTVQWRSYPWLGYLHLINTWRNAISLNPNELWVRQLFQMSSKNAPFFRTKKDIQCQWPQFRDIPPQLSQHILLPSQQQQPNSGWGQPPDIYILFRQFSGHHWKIFPDRLFSDNYFYILQSHGGMLGLPRPDFLQRIKQRILCECFSNIFSRQVTVRIRLVRDGSSFVSLLEQRSQTYQWLFPVTGLGIKVQHIIWMHSSSRPWPVQSAGCIVYGGTSPHLTAGSTPMIAIKKSAINRYLNNQINAMAKVWYAK